MRRGFHRLFFVSTVLASSAGPVLAQTGTHVATPEGDRSNEEAQGRDARGQGIKSLQAGNYFSAAAAFKEAAGSGDADSMHRLGDMAFAGKGVAQNYEQAVRWYCRAALAGRLASKRRLAEIDLGRWSESRDAKGWEAACEQWLEPEPPPPTAQTQSSESTPEVRFEVRVEKETVQEEPDTYVVWPGYLHPSKRWRRREGSPLNPSPMPLLPRAPEHRRHLGTNPLYPPPMPLLQRAPGYGQKSFKR